MCTNDNFLHQDLGHIVSVENFKTLRTNVDSTVRVLFQGHTQTSGYVSSYTNDIYRYIHFK